MARQTTRWRPDTCGCVITYTWDDTEPEDQRTHPLQAIVKCAVHAGLADAAAYTVVRDLENRLKNEAKGDLMDRLNLADDEVAFSFDANRALVLKVPARARAGATLRQPVFDQKYGAGKVRIEANG